MAALIKSEKNQKKRKKSNKRSRKSKAETEEVSKGVFKSLPQFRDSHSKESIIQLAKNEAEDFVDTDQKQDLVEQFTQKLRLDENVDIEEL